MSSAVDDMCDNKSLSVHIREDRDPSMHYTYYKVQGFSKYWYEVNA